MVNTVIVGGWETYLAYKCITFEVRNGEMAEWSKAPD